MVLSGSWGFTSLPVRGRQRKTNWEWVGCWDLEAAPRDTLPPTKPHFLILPKLFYQLGIKYSNIQAQGSHSIQTTTHSVCLSVVTFFKLQSPWGPTEHPLSTSGLFLKLLLDTTNIFLSSVNFPFWRKPQGSCGKGLFYSSLDYLYFFSYRPTYIL